MILAWRHNSTNKKAYTWWEHLELTNIAIYGFDMNDDLCDKYEEKEDDESYGDNVDEDESREWDDDSKCE